LLARADWCSWIDIREYAHLLDSGDAWRAASGTGPISSTEAFVCHPDQVPRLVRLLRVEERPRSFTFLLLTRTRGVAVGLEESLLNSGDGGNPQSGKF
jgi:hypothetical protein